MKHKFILKKFPFDVQEIQLNLPFYFYDINQVELNLKEVSVPVDLYNFPNSEWEIVSFTKQDITNFTHGNIVHSIAMSSLLIKRNGRQIEIYLILPSLFCGIAFLFYRFNPIGDQVRLDFVVNMLLAIILFLLVITEQVPYHNDLMLAENIFIFLILQAIFVILWVAISNKIFNFSNEKINYYKKKLKRINEKNQEIKTNNDKKITNDYLKYEVVQNNFKILPVEERNQIESKVSQKYVKQKIIEQEKNKFEKLSRIIDKADLYLFIFLITLSVIFNIIHMLMIHS